MSDSRTVTAVQARKSLLRAFKVQRPLFLWGPPGIGKSELVEGITQELGGLMIDLRLGQMEPTDIRGIPFYNKDIGKMDWAEPVELPDEVTAAQYPVVATTGYCAAVTSSGSSTGSAQSILPMSLL